MRQTSIVLGSLALLALHGCGYTKTARRQAERDFNCSAVEVTDLGHHVFDARGCGFEGQYQCWKAPWVGKQCTRRNR
jgi:hypothetical protein